jgi:hypothetical protein
MTLTKIIHDVEKNDIQEIELSVKELKDVEILNKINADKQLKIKTEAETKAEARQAILDRLGLTADEAKLLLG